MLGQPSVLGARPRIAAFEQESDTIAITPDPGLRAIWLRIFALFAVVVLACAVKNYLAFLLRDSALCTYLCPSVLGPRFYDVFPPAQHLFAFQAWSQEQLQRLPELLMTDTYKLGTSLLFAPLIEEAIYRGPLYLTRRFADRWAWWTGGVVLAVLFALSHGRGGLILIPLVVLGVCGVWLIASTRRFWPAVALHFLYNFFFSSVQVYQSLWISD